MFVLKLSKVKEDIKDHLEHRSVCQFCPKQMLDHTCAFWVFQIYNGLLQGRVASWLLSGSWAGPSIVQTNITQGPKFTPKHFVPCSVSASVQNKILSV